MRDLFSEYAATMPPPARDDVAAQVFARNAAIDAAKREQLPSVAGVVELLATAARNGLQFPKLRLQFADGSPLRIHVAGDKSKTPGFLQLTDGRGYGVGKWFGRVSPTGELEIARDGREIREELVALLVRLAEHPAEVAAEYGRITGNCCFCKLTLRDARSTAVGYGPICADKFGLPWGAP